MAIKIEKTFQVQEPPDNVWKFLCDPRKVASCIPGAQITEQVDDRTFKGLIKVQVGPSVTDYRGEAHVELVDEENRQVQMAGKGQDVRGKGSASMKMIGQVRPLPDGTTEVVTVSEVNVVGLLAQLGARMIQEVSNKMFEVFTANVRKQLHEERVPGTVPSPVSAEPEPIQAVPLALSVAKETADRVLKRIFGGENKS